MNRIHQYLTSLLLGATMMTPLALRAAQMQSVPRAYGFRDDERKEERKEAREHARKARRYYDREYRDYHDWDDREDRAYRQWWEQERREQQFRDFQMMRRADQLNYWRWRHAHPELFY